MFLTFIREREKERKNSEEAMVYLEVTEKGVVVLVGEGELVLLVISSLVDGASVLSSCLLVFLFWYKT